LLEVSALDITQRGEKGFRSTGKRKNITSKSPTSKKKKDNSSSESESD
jgi:hypothetical protein